MIFDSDVTRLDRLKKNELVQRLGVLTWLVKNEMLGRGVKEFTTHPLIDESCNNHNLVIELKEEECIPRKPTKIYLKDAKD